MAERQPIIVAQRGLYQLDPPIERVSIEGEAEAPVLVLHFPGPAHVYAPITPGALIEMIENIRRDPSARPLPPGTILRA